MDSKDNSNSTNPIFQVFVLAALTYLAYSAYHWISELWKPRRALDSEKDPMEKKAPDYLADFAEKLVGLKHVHENCNLIINEQLSALEEQIKQSPNDSLHKLKTLTDTLYTQNENVIEKANQALKILLLMLKNFNESSEQDKKAKIAKLNDEIDFLALQAIITQEEATGVANLPQAYIKSNLPDPINSCLNAADALSGNGRYVALYKNGNQEPQPSSRSMT